MNHQPWKKWRSRGFGCALLGGAIALLGFGDVGMAQSEGSCFLTDDLGFVYDLSALCGSSESRGPELVLQTGDVQVTLRWNTIDDLDLYVTDPAGDTVAFDNPAIPSGGALDVDANGGCFFPISNPVENIFWPTGQSPTGTFTVAVSLYTYCQEIARPIPFTLSILVRDVTQTFSGTISEAQPSVTFSFDSL